MNAAGSEVHQARSNASPPPPGPFGYSFHDPPYDAGPAPPPGPALLDDSESNMLDSFFTTINTSQFDVQDSWFQDIAHHKTGSAFGLDWAQGLPPNLEGSTTTLSQPPLLSLRQAKGSNGFIDGLGPDSEILAAASMLYGNGGNTSDLSAQHFFPNGAMPDMTTPHHIGGQHHIKQEQTHNLLANTNRRDSRHLPLQPQHTSVFNPEEPVVPVDPHTTIEVQTLRWGSDAGFVEQGYRRPAEMASVEETTQTLLDKMAALEPRTSTTNTRAPTPVRSFEIENNVNGARSSNAHNNFSRDDGDSDLPPRKRSKTKREEDDDFDDNSTPPRLKRPRSSYGGKGKRASSETATKKPKAQQNNKQSRENLTEEQKRTNHILSEQKRRNLIKQGFDELCSLVPELRGGGFSKSAMLSHAADYLEEILKGNNMLRQQLTQLKSVNGFMIPR